MEEREGPQSNLSIMFPEASWLMNVEEYIEDVRGDAYWEGGDAEGDIGHGIVNPQNCS